METHVPFTSTGSSAFPPAGTAGENSNDTCELDADIEWLTIDEVPIKVEF